MPNIIYQKSPGELIPTGERIVSTFPSGLVKVEQKFICKTSDRDKHRAILAVGNDFPDDSYPAIDGLKIFPEVQEIQKPDGFTEFQVCAYGRTNETGTVRNIVKEFESYNVEEPNPFPKYRKFKSKDQLTIRVKLATEDYDDFVDPVSFDLPILIEGESVTGSGPYTLNRLNEPQIISYGYFEEVTTKYGYVGFQVQF